jgi:hypothetical protein
MNFNLFTQFRAAAVLTFCALWLGAAAQAAFTVNSDGTVTDSATGLIWDQCTYGLNGTGCAPGTAGIYYTWQDALKAAVTANAANYKTHNDWRLPSVKELESLVKLEAAIPSIDGTAFPNTPAAPFWSSTVYTPNTASAWYVNFGDGSAYPNVKTSTYRVRLVRSGQSFDLLNPVYTVGGAVSGLIGSGLVLKLGTQTAAISANGAYAFATGLAPNTAYAVSVQTQPSSPAQQCTVSNASGSMGTTNVTNVNVSCVNAYTVTASAPGAGSGGTLSCSPATVASGSTTTCTATPDTGWQTTSISGCNGTATGAGVNSFTSGPISANCTVTVSYQPIRYAVTGTASPPVGGTVTCPSSPVTHGQTATCTVTTNAGFTLSEVSGCGGTAGSGASYTTGPVTAACAVTASYTAITTFSGTTVPPAGGTPGPASASFTGGGNTCRFDVANTAFIAAPAPPPPGQTLPQGMFKFKLIGCDTTPVAMSVTWPKPVSGYTKYGKASSGAAASSYFAPTALAVSGHTATFTVADGQLGDDDWAVNGSIVDPNGPLETVASAVTPVPTLGEWTLMALGLVLAGLGAGGLGRRKLQ